MTTFVLIDETGGAVVGTGEGLTPTKLSRIASACQLQLNRDVAPEHGGGSHLVRVGATSDIQPGEVVFAILPALPNAPGAIAYHDVTGAGVPTAYDAITLSDSLTGPGNSLSVAISHELCEIVGDEGCNLWADRGDGTEVAHELCDAVESSSYDSGRSMPNAIYVSNFVLRAFFDASRAGPYDFMNSRGIGGASSPPGPMQTAPSGGGNYQIVRQTNPQSESQVTSMGTPIRPWRHGSRRHRRGVTS